MTSALDGITVIDLTHGMVVGTAVGPPRPTPLLGEHTAEVLKDVGYSAEQVSELYEKGDVKAEVPSSQ